VRPGGGDDGRGRDCSVGAHACFPLIEGLLVTCGYIALRDA
jgi:hypothetical protein